MLMPWISVEGNFSHHLFLKRIWLMSTMDELTLLKQNKMYNINKWRAEVEKESLKQLRFILLILHFTYVLKIFLSHFHHTHEDVHKSWPILWFIFRYGAYRYWTSEHINEKYVKDFLFEFVICRDFLIACSYRKLLNFSSYFKSYLIHELFCWILSSFTLTSWPFCFTLSFVGWNEIKWYKKKWKFWWCLDSWRDINVSE